MEKKELFIVRVMWSHWPRIISASAQSLARCRALPLWARGVLAGVHLCVHIQESVPPKRAGTATGLVIQSGQRFSLVMFAFRVYENNLRWLVIDQSFNLASPARKHPAPPEVTNLISAGGGGRRWRSLLSPPSLSTPCFYNLSCSRVSEPRGPLPSMLMHIRCAWATLCRQEFCLIEFCVR